MRNDYKYIVIEGNIGAGKTSLAKKISESFNAKLVLERFADNPFLPKFYKDPERYSFPVELSFLADRYNQLKNEIGTLDIFSDFTIADFFFMKSIVFASVTLSNDEYMLYRQLFQIIYNALPKPDLFVYLHVEPENLLRNIEKRGREYESDISKEYLSKIQNSYYSYFKQSPENKYLIIDTNNLDFVNNESDYYSIVKIIFEGDYHNGLNRAFLS